jgi:arginase family enzyme
MCWLAGTGPRAICVQLDLNVLDPTEMVANRYAAGDGISITSLEAALRAVRDRRKIVAVALTSYDPECHDVRYASAIVSRLLTAALI